MSSTVNTTLSYNPPPAICSLQKGGPTLGTVVLLREDILALLSQGKKASGSVAKSKVYAKRRDQHLFSGWISAYHELGKFPLATIIMEKKINER